VERVLGSEPSVGPVRLVCVDGPAGAGKTRLAAALAAALAPDYGEVPVVHGDDVYEGWEVVASAPDRADAFARLPVRLTGWLLDPWSAGAPGAHPVWDWYVGRWGSPRVVPAAPVVVLEGVGLAAAPLRSRAALSVWVDPGPGDLLDAVVARDGEPVRTPMADWQRDEAAWHRLDGTRAGCDVRWSRG
jgi:uridine kinase